MNDLRQRLDRLERENRRFKGIAALGALSWLAWAACSVAPQAGTVVAAQRFVLTGEDGEEHAVLELDPKGYPMLLMKKDQAIAVLTMAGPALHMRGPDGKRSAFIGIDTRGSSRVELTSEKIVDGVRLAVQPDGSNGLYLLDQDGRERVNVENLSVGNASVLFKDEVGRPRCQLGTDPKKQPSLLLLDPQAGRRIGMLVQEDGTPLLGVEDGAGRLRARLTTKFDGSPLLEMLREDGQPSFTAP